MTDQARRRMAALLEVAGVVTAGGLVTNWLVSISGIAVSNPLATFRAGMTGAELLSAARQMAVILLLQYLGLFLLAVPVNWWHRRRGPADYGLTTAGHSVGFLVVAGLATCALSGWPVLGVGVLKSVFPSETVPWRQAFYDMSWQRWEFWLFSAVASWVLIPVLEELFFRGYCQRRIAEDWGDGPAILGTACLFTFQHAQYQIPNLYNAGMIAGLLVSAIGFGVVFAWTRSLIPAIIAHAIFDIPMTPGWQSAVVLIMLAGAFVNWKRAWAIVKLVAVENDRAAYAALAALGTVWAVLASRIGMLEYVGAGMLALAVALYVWERRQSPIQSGASAGS